MSVNDTVGVCVLFCRYTVKKNRARHIIQPNFTEIYYEINLIKCTERSGWYSSSIQGGGFGGFVGQWRVVTQHK